MLRPLWAASLGLTLLLGSPVTSRVALAHPYVNERLTHLSELIDAQPTASLYVQRAEVHRRAGHADAARRDLKRARSLDARTPGLELASAALALDTGDFAVALAHADRHLHHSPTDGYGYLLKARSHAGLGQISNAVSAMDRTVQHVRPFRPEHFIERFNLQCSLGEEEEALAGLAQGRRLLGSVVALERAALELELHRGDYDAAVTRLERMLAAMGRNAQWHEWHADALRRAGREMEALAAYSEALHVIETLPAGRRSAPASRALEERIRSALRHEEASP